MSDAPLVLVIDDEQVVLDSVRKHLRRESYEIETVLDPEEALEIVRTRDVDIVVTDLMMPGMDGLQLIDRIRALGKTVPVIMVTGYATMRTALQALRKGAFDYIAKPFTRSELQGVVARAARQIRRTEAAVAAEETVRLAAGPDAYHHLGRHCWVLVLEDGSVRVGVQDEFASTTGEIEAVDLPGVGDVLEQGSVCARFESADGKSHTIWSPVSGSVLEVNRSLLEDPSAITRDPYGSGWLLRLEGRNLEDELSGLSLG